MTIKLGADSQRYRWLVDQISRRNITLRFCERSHEIDGPTWAVFDWSSVLGIGATRDAAIDDAMLKEGK